MGSQRTISKYNLEYFHEDLVAGDYDMPTIYPTVYEPQQLIGFNYLNTAQMELDEDYFKIAKERIEKAGRSTLVGF